MSFFILGKNEKGQKTRKGAKKYYEPWMLLHIFSFLLFGKRMTKRDDKGRRNTKKDKATSGGVSPNNTNNHGCHLLP